MSLDPFTAALDLGKVAIERIWPDANRRAEEMYKLETLRAQGRLEQLNAEVRILLAQMDVNKTEAAHSSIFVAGWRPGAGWVCVLGLFYTFFLRPILEWASGFAPGTHVPPELDMGDLITLLFGMLGIGGLRTFEKLKQVETTKLK